MTYACHWQTDPTTDRAEMTLHDDEAAAEQAKARLVVAGVRRVVVFELGEEGALRVDGGGSPGRRGSDGPRVPPRPIEAVMERSNRRTEGER